MELNQLEAGREPIHQQRPGTGSGGGPDVDNKLPLEYNMHKYILLLATVVATVTYAAGYNPPGGAWQTRGYLSGGNSRGYLAGEPIIRAIHYKRYLVFFYCNTVAFASSIVVIILILALTIWHDKEASSGTQHGGQRLNEYRRRGLLGLEVAIACDLLGLMGAYAAGTSQDEATTTNGWVLVVVFFIFVVILMVWWHRPCNNGNEDPSAAGQDSQHNQAPGSENPSADPSAAGPVLEEWHRKVLMLLTTFISSNTYTSGMSTPGGFWVNNQGGHLAGDPVLKEQHPLRLKAFFFCNTAAFGMSLLIIVILIDKKVHRSRIIRCRVLFGYITVALLSLVGAYAMGSW